MQITRVEEVIFQNDRFVCLIRRGNGLCGFAAKSEIGTDNTSGVICGEFLSKYQSKNFDGDLYVAVKVDGNVSVRKFYKNNGRCTIVSNTNTGCGEFLHSRVMQPRQHALDNSQVWGRRSLAVS